MFSLIKFHNNKFAVIKSNNVQKLKKKTCIVKYSGGKYEAVLVTRNDNKSKLTDIKLKKEKKLSSSTTYDETISQTNSNVNKTKNKFNEAKLDDSQQGKNNYTETDAFKEFEYQKHRKSQELSSQNQFSQPDSQKNEISKETLSSHSPGVIDNVHDNQLIETSLRKNMFESPNISLHHKNKNQELLVENSEQNNIQLSDITYDFDSSLMSCEIKTTLNSTNLENNTETLSFPQSKNILNQNNITTSPNSTEALSLTNEFEIPHYNTTAISKNSLLSTDSIELQKNGSYVSSEYVDTSNFSEYVPDLSVDVTEEYNKSLSKQNDTVEESNKSLSKKNDTVEEVNSPLNINKILIPHSKSKKKHFCIFCKKLQSTLSRHLFQIHNNEEEVKQAYSFPKKSQERLKILNHIRKKGDFEHNTSKQHNSGVMIVCRQQQSNCANVVDDYICCKTCRGFFSKKTIRIHKKRCGSSKNNHRCNQIDGRRLTQYIHPKANKVLKTTIFPVLRCDAITKEIRYDELIIQYGNYLSEKYALKHQYDMIRAKLRLLGRFIIEMKTLDPSIKQLKDIYKTTLYKKCILAIRSVAKWDEDLMIFKTPAVAQNLTSLVKKCAKRLNVELITEDRMDIKVQVDNFIELWNAEISLINKKATEDLTNQKRIKKTFLPLKEDINKLYTYLKGKILDAIGVLSTTFCVDSWTQLVKATLIYIQIFNRRRAGEIERLTMENFQNKETITDNIDKDILKNVSKDSIQYAKQFVRISMRGKLGRTVSILLCPMSIKALEIVIKNRAKAGITEANNYIFSKPTDSVLTKQYYRACPLLKMYSRECGAKIPERITGTNLRKHIASYTSMINAEESSVDRLANFMGHHKDIHKNIYRVSIPVAEVTCVSKILMAAVGEDDVENGEEDDVEDDVEDEDEGTDIIDFDATNTSSAQRSLDYSSSSSRKRRSTSPYGKTKRRRWNDAEKEAIFSHFGDVRNCTKLPSLKNCANIIRNSNALSTRTPEQVKTWIDNQRKCKNKMRLKSLKN